MANFDLARIQQGGGSAVTPNKPVQDDSASAIINLASNAVEGLGNLFAAQNKATLQAAEDKVSSAFAQEQTNLAQAVESGAISSTEARTRMRKNYISYISNNPGMTDTITQLHKKVVDDSGLGKVIMEGTQQEQLQEDMFKKALNEGFGSATDSPTQQAEAIEAWTVWTQGKRSMEDTARIRSAEAQELEIKGKKLSIQGQQISNQNAYINLRENQMQLQAKTALGQMFYGDYTKYQTSVNGILQGIENGSIPRQEGIVRLQQLYSERDTTLRTVGAHAGSEFVNNLAKIYETSNQLALDRASGKIELDVYKNQTERNVLAQKALITGDDQVARLVATVDLFKVAELSQMPAILNTVKDVIANNSDPNVKVPVNTIDHANSKDYFGFLKSTAATAVAKPQLMTDKGRAELDLNINKTLQGLDVYQTFIDNPAEMQSTVDFLADPSVGKYMESMPGFNAEFANKAKQVVEFTYERQVMPAIEEALTKYGNTLEPVFDGAGVSFVPRKDVMEGLESQRKAAVVETQKAPNQIPLQEGQSIALAEMQKVRNQSKEANEKIAPILNKMVRMSAHLSRTRNYKQVYESLYAPRLFGEPVQTEPKTNE